MSDDAHQRVLRLVRDLMTVDSEHVRVNEEAHDSLVES
jgi:hypothetical protein